MFALWMWVKADGEEVVTKGGKSHYTTSTNLSGPQGSHRYIGINMLNLGCPDDMTIEDMLNIAESDFYLSSSIDAPELPSQFRKPGRWIKMVRDCKLILTVPDAKHAAIWCEDPVILMLEYRMLAEGMSEEWEPAPVVIEDLIGRIPRGLQVVTYSVARRPMLWAAAVIFGMALGIIAASLVPC